MTTAAKGGFPGCPRRKIEKRKIWNYNRRIQRHKWENNLAIIEQVQKNICRFYEIFGNSDEDDEFHGFSSEECGLIAYKRIGGNNSGSSRVPDILGSPIDLKKKRVTTRLAHAKNSKNVVSYKQLKRKKKTTTRLKYSKEKDDALKRNEVQDSDEVDQCFTKYTSSNLDFHRLSESTSFGRRPTTIKQPVRKSHKTSPIKPATFIAPSMSNINNSHQVTNVTPTCLKIKLNPLDETGPGHPKVIAKALLARANKRGRKPIVRDLEEPMHTSTPISSTSKSKTKSFILPAKSSRSSRIIKANRKYVDNDSQNVEESQTTSFSPMIQSPVSEQPKICNFPNYDSPSPNKGRPLLKEPTFRVAALANINNKSQPSRNDKVISTRLRARKLIKRARFKHPTSSSTLVVGNDFDDETTRKKNLIREATFKMPDQKQSRSSAFTSEKNQLSDLGLSKEEWEKILHNEIRYEADAPPWTIQEIHNVLQGANTFTNSWTSVARHFDYHQCHRDWCSVRTKSRTLINVGLLSENLKVKSSILLQLKPQYSDNPNVTVFTAKELKIRGMEQNLECDVGEGGRMIKGLQVIKNPEGDIQKGTLQRQRKRSQQSHRNYFSQWRKCISEDLSDANFKYFGLDKTNFQKMCVARNKGKPSWSVREIHNVLHGIHIFGVGEWNTIHEMYLFNPRHNNLGIRGRFKSVSCRGLVIAGEVREDILKLLRPKFSARGKRYFGIRSNISSPEEPAKEKKLSTEINDQILDIKKQKSRKRTASSETISDSDITSPPRKQAYHLFGAAPVWDDSSSGLQSLKSNSEIDEEDVCEEELAPSVTLNKNVNVLENEKERKTTNDAPSIKTKKLNNDTDLKKKTSGPRIKHVCRRASLVTGQKPATYDDDSGNPQLSALPKDERQKIAAEAERLREVRTDLSISSDSDLESKNSPVKPVIRRKEKTKSSQVHQIRKRNDKNKAKRCNCCVNCKIQSCGECENCRSSSLVKECIRRLPCLNPIDNNVVPTETVEKTRQQPKRNSTLASNDDILKQVQRTASSGVILSPDSRHRVQQELHERDQHLPSVVKIDEWKERYELEDLWKMGGVSIITSTTPSTRLLCYLCGSLGRTRPARRVSSTSDSSISSIRSDCTTQIPLFIFCYSCCEPFHSFCLDDHEQQQAIAAAKKGIWICKRCRFCNVCGRPGNLLECKRCNKTYHSACLGPSYPTKPSKNHVWVCMRCVRCRSCGVSRPGRRPGSKWTHDFQLCQRCGDLFDKGNFCPICRRCYRDEDYESRMVQCGTCKRWVHSRCESLTTEMYTLLSHLPDDVQYVCPDCDGRRNKVEHELSHSDTILTDDSANDSLDGDKMRGLLCKLPSPSWKKRIESEVQSGIENVMMALFHNKEAACILKTSVVQQEDGRPVDLFAVRFAVHNRQYKSVSDFSSDVCCILDNVPEDAAQINMLKDEKSSRKWKRKRNTIGARGAFFKEMHDVFPWFDVETGRVRDASDVPEDLLPHATLPPHMDHNYAQWQDRDIDIMSGGPDTPIKNPFANDSPSKPDDIGTVVWATTPQKQYDDMRQCLFCAQYGDDHATNAGRLVYCGQDEWVHVNCALWSAEVFERHDGSLQNVYSAVSRGKMMKCEQCKLPGATVGCNTKDCPQNYHFSCAKLAGCTFQDDKKVFCARHVKHVDNEIVNEEGFEVARRVVVDKDEMRPNKRWQRGMFSQNITILMGSAIVHQLGQLSPSSDTKDYLMPVQFRMTRMFWSTVHAGRRVRYTITVTEQKSVIDGPARIAGTGTLSSCKTESHGNRTISHADDEKLPANSLSQHRRIPGVDACRSKLVDRFHTKPDHGPLHRRRSHDQSTVDPGVLRSRRFSGSSYTVVGSVNRTLPQAITPLPSISRSSTTFQRLLPTVQESKNNEFHKNSSETEENITQSKTQLSSESFESDIKNAVKVSFQNPYLNVGLDIGDAASLVTKTSVASKDSNKTNTASLNYEKTNELDNLIDSKSPSVVSSMDTKSNAENYVVLDQTNLHDGIISSDLRCSSLEQLASLCTKVSDNSGLKLGSSGNILHNTLPAQSAQDHCEKAAIAPITTISSIEYMTPLVGSSDDDSSQKTSSLLDQMLSSTESITILNQVEEKSDQSMGTCEVQPNISASKIEVDLNKEAGLSEVKIPTESEDPKTASKRCPVKENTVQKPIAPISTFLDSKVNALSSNQTTLPPIVTTVSTEESECSNTMSLFKGAKIAQKEESTTESIENVKNKKTLESERLWWQKDKSSLKRTKTHKKPTAKPNSSVDDAWILPESEKDSMTIRSSSEEDKVSTMQTRSKKSSKENPTATESVFSDEEKDDKATKDEETISDIIKEPMLTDSSNATTSTSKDKIETMVKNIGSNASGEMNRLIDETEAKVENIVNNASDKEVAIKCINENQSISKTDKEKVLNSEDTYNKTKIAENNPTESNKEQSEEVVLDLCKISVSSKQSFKDSIIEEAPKSANSDVSVENNKHDKKNTESSISSASTDTSSLVSSASEASFIDAQKDAVKIRNLRKFAKINGQPEKECTTEAITLPTKIDRRRNKKGDTMTFRRTTRSFSHENSATFEKHNKVICNGNSDPGDIDHKILIQKDATRLRSKSVDAAKKRKQKLDALKKVKSDLEISDTDFSPHRYPRRNPFTCLKSFSGLSPNYAIQSYSPSEQGRQNRAKARLLDHSKRNAVKRKKSKIKTKKRLRTRSEKGIEEDVSDCCKTAESTEDEVVEERNLRSKSKSIIKNVNTEILLKNERSDHISDAHSQSTVLCEAAKSMNAEKKSEETESAIIEQTNTETDIISEDTCSDSVLIVKPDLLNTESKNMLDDKSVLEKVEQNIDGNVLSVEEAIHDKGRMTPPAATVVEHCTDKNLETHSNNEKSSTEKLQADFEKSQTDEFSSIKISENIEKELPSTQPVSSPPPPRESTESVILTDEVKLSDKKVDFIPKAIKNATTNKNLKDIHSTETTTKSEDNLTNEDSSKIETADDNTQSKLESSNIETETNVAMKFEDVSRKLAIELSPNQGDEDNIDKSAMDVSYNDSIEIVRGIIEEDEKQKEAKSSMLLEPDIKQAEHKHATNQLINLPVSPLVSLPIKSNFGQEKQKVYHNTVEELESPLSPRDEPRLPLPMETDATASFLVTSDCPVLNADEVQSLLEMPTTTTTQCSDVSTPVTQVLATIPTQKQHQSYRKSYISVVNNVPQHQTYLTPSTDVALFPVTYTPCHQQVPVVVPIYNQPCTNQPMNVAIANTATAGLSTSYGVQRPISGLSQQILISPPANTASPAVGFTYGMSFGNQVMPVMVPNPTQPLTYITTPMQQTPQTFVMQSNNHVTRPQYNHFPTAQSQSTNFLTHSVIGNRRNSTTKTKCENVRFIPNVSQSSDLSINTQTTTPSAISRRKSVESNYSSQTLPNKQDPSQILKKDVHLTSEQQDMLNQMIEFYSNKNKLSDEEKLIVRTIIAQQIQNKSLPMPSPDATPQSSSENVETNNDQWKPGIDKPAILQRQKRKQSLTEPCETPVKRIKKSKRKEKIKLKESNSVDKASKPTKEPSFPDKISDLDSSPLLNVYLNATRAEHKADEKLVKKWRDIVWNLSRHSVHMDVPWLTKRGHRDKENRLPPPPQSSKRSHLLYEIKSEDGYCAEGTDLHELIANLLDSVQECRANACVPSPSLCLASILSPYAFLGVSHDAVRFLVEQLPGARHCLRYRAKYHKHREPPAEVITHINPHGCARAEKYQGRSKPDMFSFLASKHRLPPSYDPSLTQNVDMQQNSTRRPTSMDLPMAMRFRHLRTSAHEAVGVYRSAIHGRGLYCKRDIEAGEMVMEYTGEVIRCFLTDHREKMYEKKGIGCYMFRMDDMYVVDATMMGSGARFINHSCEPSCYSRIVSIDGKKHIIIFALRKILRGEELTYDYKFPIEADDQKIMCNCGAKTCRKYMN